MTVWKKRADVRLMVDRQGRKVDVAIEDAIRASMTEETKAAKAYRERAKIARAKGYITTADLYEHIAKEEDQHWREFSAELSKVRKGVE
jgi:rubrerythrin